MFFTAPMRYMQIVVLEKDFQHVIDLLADYGWLEIKRSNYEKSDKFIATEKALNQIEDSIIKVTNFFEIDRNINKGLLKNLDTVADYFSNLSENIQVHQEKLNALNDRKRVLESGLNEIEQFKNLRITKKELENFNFLFFKTGSMTKADLEILTETMKERIIYTELSRDLYIIFTSKKGRWTLESELKKINFKEKNIPFEGDTLPSEVYKALNTEINAIKKDIDKIEVFRNELFKKEKNNIFAMMESFNLLKIYQDLYQNINHSGSTSIIEGWIAKKNLSPIVKNLNKSFGDRVSIVSYKPDELDEVKNGTLKVPVIMDNFSFFKPFEELVFNYGAPLYGNIDPTVFVGISFLFLFGFMFGDVGQGFVILLVGTLLRLIRGKGDKNTKNIATIMQYAGTMAIIFGFIYGSFFSFEHLGFFAKVNNFIFGLNQPYLLDTSVHNSQNVIKIALLTIGIGLCINTLGILFNIINSFIHEKYREALFSRNGLAGFVLMSSILTLYLEATLFKVSVSSFLVYVIIGAVFVVVFKEPIYNIFTNKRPIIHHSMGIWILHSIVDLLEVILITISNNLSFVRVGAFAITHALLSFIFLNIAKTLGIFGPLIVVLGNAIIIGLEGMIVGIQVIRLEYYEFFSKFFIDKGKKFIPFKIEREKIKEIA